MNNNNALKFNENNLLDSKNNLENSNNNYFKVDKGPLNPYIFPENIKFKYEREDVKYGIEYVMQAGTVILDDFLHISIFRAVTKDGANDLNFPLYVYRRISVFGLKVENIKNNESVIFPFPILYPIKNIEKYNIENIFKKREQAGIEDPRIMIVNNKILLTYSAYNGKIASVGFASMNLNVFKMKVKNTINLIKEKRLIESEDLWDPLVWQRHGYLDCGKFTNSNGKLQEMDDRDTCVVDELIKLEDGRYAYPIIHRSAPNGKGILKTLKLSFLPADENGNLELNFKKYKIQLLKNIDTNKIIEKKIILPEKTPDKWLYSGLGLNGAPIKIKYNNKNYYLISLHSGRVVIDKKDPEVVHDYKVGFIICDQYFNTIYIQEKPIFSPELTSMIHETRKKWWVKWVRISAGHFVIENEINSNGEVKLNLKMLITINDTEIRSSICKISINIKKIVEETK